MILQVNTLANRVEVKHRNLLRAPPLVDVMAVVGTSSTVIGSAHVLLGMRSKQAEGQIQIVIERSMISVRRAHIDFKMEHV